LPGESSVVSVRFSRDRDIRVLLSGFAALVLLLAGVRVEFILFDDPLNLLGSACYDVFNWVTI